MTPSPPFTVKRQPNKVQTNYAFIGSQTAKLCYWLLTSGYLPVCEPTNIKYIQLNTTLDFFLAPDHSTSALTACEEATAGCVLGAEGDAEACVRVGGLVVEPDA